jgi:hypothetical protein
MNLGGVFAGATGVSPVLNQGEGRHWKLIGDTPVAHRMAFHERNKKARRRP